MYDNLMRMDDMGWIHEDKLYESGLDAKSVDNLVWGRDNHDGKEYLGCEVKGMLVREGLADKDGYRGCVDPYRLAKVLSENFDVTIDDIFQRLESSPALWTEDVAGNRIYRGVRAETIGELCRKDIGKVDIENLVKGSEAIREYIPAISINSTRCNPFQALAYIFEKAGKLEPQTIAEDIGESPSKVALLLYKNDRLMLSDREAWKMINKYKDGEDISSMPDSFTDQYGDMSISELVKNTDMSYEEVLLLTRAGLLEKYKIVNRDYTVENRISSRSIIYHLSQLDDKAYLEKVGRALSQVLDSYPRNFRTDDIDFKYGGSWFQYHMRELREIPPMSASEEKDLARRMLDVRNRIVSEVAATSFMKDEVERLHDNVRTPSFFRAFSHKIKRERSVEDVRADFVNMYDRLSGLYQQFFERDDSGLEEKIAEQVKDLDLRYEIAEGIVRKFRNYHWDIKIIDQQLSKHCGEQEALREGDTKAIRRYRFNKKAIERLQRRKDDILKSLDLTQEELESKMDRITGDEALLERYQHEFVMRNARLALKIAGGGSYRYSNAMEGLMRAAELVDPQMDNKFSVYMETWMRTYILVGLRKTGNVIKKTSRVYKFVNKISGIRDDLTMKLGRMPTLEEQYEAYNNTAEKKLSFKQFEDLSSISMSTISLDDPVGDGKSFERNESARVDLVESPKTGTHYHDPLELLMKKEDMNRGGSVFNELDARQAKVLKMRFGVEYEGEHTLQEVGDSMNLSRERVRQIERDALKLLDSKMRS